LPVLRREKHLGLSLEGSGPCAHSRKPGTRWAPERRTGSILAPSLEETQRASGATASNLDTLLGQVGREVRMLLSFQRPSHLFRKLILLRGRPRHRGDPGADASV